MDPNANLAEQLRLADHIRTQLEGAGYAGYLPDVSTESLRLAQLVEALNDWIQTGGGLPSVWTREN